ncbi:MAG: hypothetical protein ABSH28_23035 [Acidobacteriota bacterium]
MKSVADYLKFACEIAGDDDVDHLQRWKLLKWTEDLQSFLGTRDGANVWIPGGILAVPIEPPLPQDYGRDEFRDLQVAIRTVLDGVTREYGMHEHTNIKFSYSLHPIFGHYIMNVMGATRDVFLFKLALLLAGEASRIILKCPEPKCGKFFYRVRKQKYCSRLCTVRASVRNKRNGLAKPKGKDGSARILHNRKIGSKRRKRNKAQ